MGGWGGWGGDHSHTDNMQFEKQLETETSLKNYYFGLEAFTYIKPYTFCMLCNREVKTMELLFLKCSFS